eukprot:TRINITY_DN1285_c2_g2_i1.p1 TRINITY_DN1285_c2_g2~~TRINITY_DN1285_c2_g2_i1.p1  ORF type:complete len:389 (-),score=45.91 TRINITY_DN1285_c2_g2_i1:50-1186(-)
MTSAPVWFSRIMVSWGIISVCMMFVKDYMSLVLVRLFLGLAEAGLLPGIVYYLSLWFTPTERAYRLGLFISSIPFSGLVSGLAAYGILQMDGMLGLRGWQWLFLIEGTPTIIFGFFAYFLLPVSPSTVSWLTPSEKTYLSTLITTSPVSPTITLFDLRSAFANPRVWVFALANLFLVLPIYSISYFLPTFIKILGYSDLLSNLLTVPAYFLACICLVLNARHSDKTHERCFHVVWTVVLALLAWGLEIYSLYTDYTWLQYTALVIATAAGYAGTPVFLTWMTEIKIDKEESHTVLAVSSAIIIGLGNVGGIVGPLLFGWSFTLSNTYVWGCVGICAGYVIGLFFVFLLWSMERKTIQNTKQEEQLINENHSLLKQTKE